MFNVCSNTLFVSVIWITVKISQLQMWVINLWKWCRGLHHLTFVCNDSQLKTLRLNFLCNELTLIYVLLLYLVINWYSEGDKIVNNKINSMVFYTDNELKVAVITGKNSTTHWRRICWVLFQQWFYRFIHVPKWTTNGKKIAYINFWISIALQVILNVEVCEWAWNSMT